MSIPATPPILLDAGRFRSWRKNNGFGVPVTNSKGNLFVQTDRVGPTEKPLFLALLKYFPAVFHQYPVPMSVYIAHLDIAVLDHERGLKIAVEADGHQHFQGAGKDGEGDTDQMSCDSRRETASEESARIANSNDVFNLLSDMQFLDREALYCIHLSTKQDVIAIEEVSKGTINQSLVHPREVYKAAMLSNAYSIIIVHNHPSGDPTPSREDFMISRRIAIAGDVLGVKMLDSIIIGHGCHHSMKDSDELNYRSSRPWLD